MDTAVPLSAIEDAADLVLGAVLTRVAGDEGQRRQLRALFDGKLTDAEAAKARADLGRMAAQLIPG